MIFKQKNMMKSQKSALMHQEKKMPREKTQKKTSTANENLWRFYEVKENEGK